MKNIIKKFILCWTILFILTSCNDIQEDNNGTSKNQETPAQESIIISENDFELNIFSDAKVYADTDIIKIWATFEYTGNENAVTIWHGDPYIMFSVTDGKDFNTDGAAFDILDKTILEKGVIYHYDYFKSGGYGANDSDADFWRNFYSEKDLLLPAGEYIITVSAGFSTDRDNIIGSRIILKSELTIEVTGDNIKD